MSEGTELAGVPQPPKKARKVRSDAGKKRGARKKGVAAKLARSFRGLSRSAKRARKKLKKQYKTLQKRFKKARKARLKAKRYEKKIQGRRSRRRARVLRGRGRGSRSKGGFGGKSKFGLWLVRKLAKMVKRGSQGDFRNHGFTGSGKGGRTGRRGFHR